MLVSALVAVAVGQLGYVPVPKPYRVHEHSMYWKVAERSRTDARTADVIVMGDSRVLFGIDTKVLARQLRIPGGHGGRPTIVDLAAPAATPAGGLWMWRRALGGTHPPRARLAVIGVAPVDFTPKTPGNDNVLRYLFEAPDVLWLARDGRMNYAAALLTYRVFPLYALHRSIINMVIGQRQREPVLPPPSPAEDAYWLAQHEAWYSDYRIDPWQVRCLERMVSEMRARGIRVILFTPPVAESLLRIEAGISLEAPMSGGSAPGGMPGSPLRLFRDMIRGFQAREGVTYFDYMRAAHSRRFEFWDPTHLLPTSASTFTRELAGRIKDELARGRA